MSAGIYMYNGQLAYSLNLEKKLKRRKGAIIIEECVGNPTEEELQKLLDKHNNIVKATELVEDKPLKYHWLNLKTKHTHHSIYPELRYKSDPENWIPFTYKDENTILVEKLPETEYLLGRKIDKIENYNNQLIVTLI